jgi:hypothetical protein
MSDTKEINYFNIHHDEPDTWYSRFFEGSEKYTAIGEASPLYMWDPDVAERMHSLIPAAQLLFVLRDPVDRAYSNYWFNRARGAQDPSVGFAEAIRTEDGYHRYVSKGFYDTMLERYWERFGRNQIKVVVSERLRSDVQATMKDVFDYLGVDPSVSLESTGPRNVTRYPKNAFIGSALYHLSSTWKSILKRTPEPVKAPLRGLKAMAEDVLYDAPGGAVERPPLGEDARDYLNDMYADEFAALTERLDMEIPEWSVSRTG